MEINLWCCSASMWMGLSFPLSCRLCTFQSVFIGNVEKLITSPSNPWPILSMSLCLLKEDDPAVFGTNSLQRRKKGLGLTGLRPTGSGSTHSKNKHMIGLPQDFRQISSIIDVDILPETHRRVRLHKHGTHKPLGFYIRDGVSMRVTPQGVEKVGIIPLCVYYCR